MFLVDTNVISEIGKGRRCERRVADWYAAVERDSLWLSVLVVGELRSGIERVRRRDPARAMRLERALILTADLFADRVLAINRRIAERWGLLEAERVVSTIDGLIAATALVHRLTVVTRNVRDFAPTGVAILNPFEPPA